MSTPFWCEHVWLGSPDGSVDSGVLIEVDDGVITSVSVSGATPRPHATVLRGLTIPGLANTHSHSFHRALRGRTEGQGASTTTFWDWRDQMYAVASSIDPDRLRRLARATFAEMVLAGITLVGEFHYLHHDVGGGPFASPNVMGEAVVAAAADVGVRLTLLDTCYLHGGLGTDGYLEPSPVQSRFADRDVDAWVERASAIAPSPMMRVGAAVHSVRAVDPGSISVVAGWANDMGAPLHAHVSEQPAENEQCLAIHGISPVAVFTEAGAVGRRFTAIHGTHLTDHDMSALGSGKSTVCLCPTTERDLADGVGRGASMVAAGASLAVGSDSQSVIDLLEEARSIELDERLATRRRGHHSPAALLTAATANGYRSLGWPDGGRLEVGAPADLTTLRTDTPRLAGVRAAGLVAGAVFAATAADVGDVVVGGAMLVSDGHHTRLDVAAELREALG